MVGMLLYLLHSFFFDFEISPHCYFHPQNKKQKKKKNQRENSSRHFSCYIIKINLYMFGRQARRVHSGSSPPSLSLSIESRRLKEEGVAELGKVDSRGKDGSQTNQSNLCCFKHVFSVLPVRDPVHLEPTQWVFSKSDAPDLINHNQWKLKSKNSV